MTDCVEFIYLFFSVTLFLLCKQQDLKLIQYFDKTNKIAIRLFLYNLNILFPLRHFFLLCCRLNFCLNELYPDKLIQTRNTIFVHLYFLCDTFFPTLLAAVNKFKTLYKMNKIANTILCRIDFYMFAYCYDLF